MNEIRGKYSIISLVAVKIFDENSTLTIKTYSKRNERALSQSYKNIHKKIESSQYNLIYGKTFSRGTSLNCGL